MPAAKATPIFSISAQYNGFDFNPEMCYAQVLAEAGNHGRSETLKQPSSINGWNTIVAGDISSSKPADVEKSVRDVKRRRPWKNVIFFWRKLLSRWKQDKEQYEVQARPQRSGFKSRSGPIYTNDFHVDQPRRSSGAHSGPLAGTLTLHESKLVETHYVALKHPNHTGIYPSTAPLYLVT